MTVTVVVPTIPPRADMLLRALGTVAAQTRPADAISIAVDTGHEGAVVTRNRALAGATTDWLAFLDDDDELLPNHLEELVDTAEETGADVVYPNFRCVDRNGSDVQLPPNIASGHPFDAGVLRVRSYIPVTVLARTELVHRVGGFSYPKRGTRYEDWGLWLKMLRADAQFHHHPVTTWTWNHHGANTSGQGDRW